MNLIVEENEENTLLQKQLADEAERKRLADEAEERKKLWHSVRAPIGTLKERINQLIEDGKREGIDLRANAINEMAKVGNSMMTPIHVAAMYSTPEHINLLLKHGADINILSSEHKTPMLSACSFGNENNAIHLMKLGCKHLGLVDTFGYCGLHYAFFNGREMFNLAKLILKEGENIHAREKYGKTPAHIAAHFGKASSLRFLRDHGADLTMTSTEGWTTIHSACAGRVKSEEHQLVLNMLLQEGRFFILLIRTFFLSFSFLFTHS